MMDTQQQMTAVWEVVYNDSESYYTLVHVGTKAEADAIVEHLNAIDCFEGYNPTERPSYYSMERTIAGPRAWSLADAWELMTDEPALEESVAEVRLSVEAALDAPEETTRDVAFAQQLKDADRGN
jgi:hypothetical protein